MVSDTLNDTKSDSFLLVIAGDLSTSAKLRSFFEKANNAASLPCYADDQQAASNMIAQQLRDAGMQFERHLPSYIAELFAGDRMIIRSELVKIITYMGSEHNITIADVDNIICSIKEENYQQIANSIADLDLTKIELEINQHLRQGVYPLTIIRVIANYFMRLSYAKYLMGTGMNANEVVNKMRPPIFFKQKPIFMKHLQIWHIEFINKFLNHLQQLEIQCKSNSQLPADVMLLDLTIKIAYSLKQRKMRQ